MEYVHIIVNNAVTNPFIDFVNKNFDSNEHRFFIIRGWNEKFSPINKYNNVRIINGLSNIYNGFFLIWDILFSKKIFIHGLYTPYVALILYLMPWVLKKCNWSIWGADLHFYTLKKESISLKFHEFLRVRIIRKMGKILTSISGDYQLAKKWYNVRCPMGKVLYGTPLKMERIDKIIEQYGISVIDKKVTKFIIGNSASEENNHFEILKLLEQHKTENIQIFALLSYGDSQYSAKVIETGTRIYGDKFVGVTNYLTYDEFVLFMNSMDILIFNHERQQGLGNLFLAMYLEKKVFINEKSSLWNYFNDDLGLDVEITSSIKFRDYKELITIDTSKIEKNKNTLRTILSEIYLTNLWKEQFN